MNESSDETLWEAWCGGDKAAGDALVQRYFLAIVRFFRSKVYGHADELTQATFLGCVEARARMVGGRFRPFLYGIARKKLLQHFERRGRSVDADGFSHFSVADLADSPSRIVADDDQRRRVLQALQHIPVDHQIVIELAYWEEMPLAEIAEVVGAPTGTIKSRLSRARAKLAEELAKLGVSRNEAELADVTRDAAAGLGDE